MPYILIRDDITRVKCDAVINPTDEHLSGSGGVDHAIHKAAGSRLDRKCAKAGIRAPGSVFITKGYGLDAKHLIHIVSPVFSETEKSSACEKLKLCCRAALDAARDLGCESAAMPLIGTGTNEFDRDTAFNIAQNEIKEFLSDSDMTIYLVLYDKESYLTAKEYYSDITEYINDSQTLQPQRRSVPMLDRRTEGMCYAAPPPVSKPKKKAAEKPGGSNAYLHACPTAEDVPLEEYIKDVDKGFSEALLDLIDKSGMTDVQCYKKANIDRKLFSKIRSNPSYKPKKTTALAFCIALSLSLEETAALLEKAGYALSRSNKGDLIIEYFIKNGNYDIYEINEALFNFDQTLLGV